MLLPLIASAYTFEIDGIYYNMKVTGTTKTAEVTYRDNNYNSYSGSVTIPTSITYSGETYSVTSIDWYAFYGCTGLTSIEIPSSVTIIGSYAFYSCTGLTSIEIPNSVTFIGDRAFSGCSGLTSIEIPNSVTSIGWYTFQGCTGLTSIEIPNSVTSIGSYAFYGCTGLTSIEISNSVTTIEKYALYGCSGLTSIKIPNSVTKIGSYAFAGCTGLTSVHITDLSAWCKISFNYQESNPLWYAKHLYLNDEEVINLVIPNGVTRISGYAFCGCSSMASIEIPNSVTWIGNGAFFDCSGLASIEIPNSVTSIGSWAFHNCSGLTSLVIGNNVTNIGTEAFSGCTSILSLHIPQGTNFIDESAFLNCTGLESIVVDSGNPKYDSRNNCNAIIETATNKLIVGSRNTIIPQSVTDYGQYGLANCVKLTLPEGIEEIPTLYYCKVLESITIPNSIKKIFDTSFNGCSSLKTIIIEDGTEDLIFEPVYHSQGYQPRWYIDNPLDSIYFGRNYKTSYYTYYPFNGHPTLRAVAFGEEVKSIGDNAFCTCSNLQSIKLGSQIETIGTDAFWKSSNLDTIVIPSSIKAIGSNAFCCSHISTLIIEDGEDLELYNGAKDIEFKGGTIDSLYLGRSNVNIVFKRIKHFTIGKINKIGSAGGDTINVLDILENPDTLRIPVYQNNTYAGGRINYYYTTPFNNKMIDSLYCNRIISVYDTYNENSTVHPFEGIASSFKLEIGENLTDIADGMFYGCKIPSLFIPNNIKHISPTAFNNCNILSSVLIEDSAEPLDFGEGNNFYGCQLRDVYIGRTMKFSTNSPFNRNKEGIQKLTFGNNVTEIPDNVFTGLKNVKELTLPKNLKTIGSMAFYGCEGLTELTIPGSVTEIGQQAFDLCRGLKTLTFEDGEEELAFTAEPNYINNAFANSPLEDIYLGRNLIYPNVSPFFAIESIKELTLGSKVTRLSDRVFAGCPNLKEVYSNSETVPTTGENVFTESYLANATLHVPYSLYDEYRVTYPWNKFGNIINYEGKYNLFYMVDEVEYKKYVVNEGDVITPETEPTKDGYIFSGWSEIPETMPAHDVTVTGTFTLDTGIMQVGSEASDGAVIYTLDGKRINKQQRGLNIIRMKDGKSKKVVIK